MYGRVWPHEEPQASRDAQNQDALYRMRMVDPDAKPIGLHYEKEPRFNRRRPALGKAIDQCKETGAVLCVTALEGLAGNEFFRQQITWSRVPIAFVEIPGLEPQPVHRPILRALGQFEEGLLQVSPAAWDNRPRYGVPPSEEADEEEGQQEKEQEDGTGSM